MQSIETSVSNFLEDLDEPTAKIFKISQNNARFKAAVLRQWADTPGVGEYILAHTNSIFFKEDTAPRIGPNKDKKIFVLKIFMDDSMARAELNARREPLLLSLAQEGLHVDGIWDINAQRDIKKSHLYPEYAHPSQENNDNTHEQSGKNKGVSCGLGIQDQAYLLEIFKRALCLTFQDIDTAQSILDKIEGASLDEVFFSKRSVHAFTYYWCNLYVSEQQLEKLQTIMNAYGDTIISRARALKLYLRAITLRKSSEEMKGKHAFPSLGAPLPLISYKPGEPPTESSRIAAEVRQKISNRKKEDTREAL